MRRLYVLVFMFIVAGSANVFSMQPMFGYNQGMQSTTFNGASTIQYVDLIHELSLSPDGWAFPDTNVGSTATQVFTLSNAGNYRAEDLAVTVTGTGFSESSRTCAVNPFVMGSMSSCTVTAQFAPTSATMYNGFVNYSAPNIAKVSVALSGTGVNTNTVLVGHDTIETGELGNSANKIYYYETAYPTPLGQPSLAAGTGTTVSVRIGSTSWTNTLWVYVARASDGLILQKGSKAITSGDADTWVDVTLAGSVSIEAATNYLIGIATDTTGMAFKRSSTRPGTAVTSYTGVVDLSTVTTITRTSSSGTGPISLYLK